MLRKGPAEMVPIGSLVQSGSLRLAGENKEHAYMLAESEAALPPIIVHRSTRHVIDGMHRLAAAELRGDTEISVVFYDGSEQDAFIIAVQANVEHGLPLSLADRTTAAERIIVLRPHWSDRAIARVTGLSPKTVAKTRRCSTAEIPHLHTRVGRDGRVRPVDSADGRQLAGDLIKANPDASIRQIALRAGISQGTARDVRDRLRRGENPVLAQRSLIPAAQPVNRAVVQEEGGSRASVRVTRHAALLQNLKGDPSLRFNEVGRGLIRSLDACPVDETERVRLVDNVPAHCAGSVAELAEMYAQVWQDLATKLRQGAP
ncbi:ParB-like chromosome segregation protein Spo0J [Saccharopolyspora lacisalsi]|uniref:ParB-like chromosome segregation protein Spo0J n=1 Tax=Halosaccharopolyspora lacisalsi TaxID=1000566 RepID=A0A839E402_9PSEU|nr:streptomycin biosynthesis protein [Halosaccharopolyspora lacisalsi]MBA8827770.1 ParB-like chromosome segregation protein Spo0J [Halosaccharopolyspora lacisalsi]